MVLTVNSCTCAIFFDLGRAIVLFIHSFMLNTYIVPPQENYSKALPNPAWLKVRS